MLDLSNLVLDVEHLVLVDNKARERLQECLVLFEQLTLMRQRDLVVARHVVFVAQQFHDYVHRGLG